MNFFSTFINYLSYPFVRYALITGTLIALCSSLLGVILVLRRFSYIGDGLSHVAFGAMALASVLGLTNNDIILILPITIICAVLILKGGSNKKINGDASIAMISVGSLAIGYLLMNIFSPSTNLSGDVCTTLFGSTSILTLTKTEVVLSIVLSLCSVLFFVLFYNKLFAITFDETFARSSGIKTADFGKDVLDRFTLRAIEDAEQNRYFKTIVNPREIKGFVDPHFAIPFKGRNIVLINKQITPYDNMANLVIHEDIEEVIRG